MESEFQMLPIGKTSIIGRPVNGVYCLRACNYGPFTAPTHPSVGIGTKLSAQSIVFGEIRIELLMTLFQATRRLPSPITEIKDMIKSNLAWTSSWSSSWSSS